MRGPLLLGFRCLLGLLAFAPVGTAQLTSSARSVGGRAPVPATPSARTALAAGETDAPRLLGEWPVEVQNVAPVAGGDPGFDFDVDLRFAGACADDPARGDVLEVGARLLRVRRPGTPLDPATGKVGDVRVRWLGEDALTRPAVLLGRGSLLAPHDPARGVPDACWLRFTPEPAVPGVDVDPSVQVTARFSEPLDPATVGAFTSFQLGMGSGAQVPDAITTVVGAVRPSAGGTRFTFSPVVPLDHSRGATERYHVRLDPAALRNPSGVSVVSAPRAVEFTLAAAAPGLATGGITLRFDAPDEFQVGAAAGAPDIRGQVFYDLGRGVLQPRPPRRFSAAVERANPVPGIMIPFPPGLGTPLSPFGSKLHQAWRYCDLGWLVQDETYHNVDVEGLAWSPVGGRVLADFFPLFEIRIAHAAKAPDEKLSAALLPRYPDSGLVSAPEPYDDNILRDPVGAQRVVHDRALGYRVDPAELFTTASGTPMQPYPWNRAGGPKTAYTWRDTAVLARGGAKGGGVPMGVETEVLGLYGPGVQTGSLYPPGEVPSIGLPLLMEFRCFPNLTSFGLNAFDVSLAINSSARPSFRSYSTGGINSAGQTVLKDPDLETVPSGGVGGGGTGTFTADNSLYLGQVDLVIRTSRAHSIWLDTQAMAPDFAGAVIAAGTPAGSRVVIDYRGADGFLGGTGVEPFDASLLDPYGDPPARGAGATQVLYHGGVEDWSPSLDGADGARYVQLRLSFQNDVDQNVAPELDALGLAFVR